MRDRLEKAQVYFEAVAPYELVDIERAVQNFISGSAPGHNPSYIPPAPLVGGETRRVMNLRVTAEARERAFRPALPPPDNVKTPESRAKFKAIVEGIVAKLALPASEDPTERHRARLRRTNEVVDAERQYWEAGDREGQDAA